MIDKSLVKELESKLDNIIEQYVTIFCKKHELDFDGWVADKTGTIGAFSDLFINFDDLRLDLESHQEVGVFEEWYDVSLDSRILDKPHVNFSTWIMGYRPSEHPEPMKIIKSDVPLNGKDWRDGAPF